MGRDRDDSMRLSSWVDEITEAELSRVLDLMARELFDHTTNILLLGSNTFLEMTVKTFKYILSVNLEF